MQDMNIWAMAKEGLLDQHQIVVLEGFYSEGETSPVTFPCTSTANRPRPFAACFWWCGFLPLRLGAL